MGTAFNLICCEDKTNNEEKRDYFITETDTSAPQSIVDIKIDSKNFIQRRKTNFFDEYEKLKFLGQGTFGSVYKIKRKNSGTREIIRALKEISKEALDECLGGEEELKNEIEVLKNLDHPNIMKI